jgi:WD40 repeat protein
MLLVDFHVWVGSLNKTIHILDVETLCHVSQLSYLEDEPRDLCLDKNEPNIVWALLLNGVVLGFDPETREKVAKIQVPDMIQHSFCTCFTIWRDFLWIGNNRGSIAIVNTVNRTNVNELTLARDSKQVEIKFLAVSSEDQIWCSVHSFPRSEDSTYISVYDPRTLKVVYTYSKLDSNHRVSFILPVKNTIWCGTKSGKIYVFSAKPEQNSNGPKILDAHDDKVRSMTYAHDNLVVSGSGSNDGYANVWLLMNWFNE